MLKFIFTKTEKYVIFQAVSGNHFNIYKKINTMIEYSQNSATLTLNKTVYKYEASNFTITVDGKLLYEMSKEEIDTITDSNAIMTEQDYLMIAMGLYIDANN